MQARYYFYISYLAEHADNGLLAGRCLSILHGFLASNKVCKNKIGVSFPKWNDDSIGNAIAFVGQERDALLGLTYQPYYRLMVSEGLFDMSSVALVPEELPDVRFIRNQTIAKSFVGSKKRRMARSIRRAQALGHEATFESNEDREFAPFHSIAMGSGSSGQEFVLHLQQKPVTGKGEVGFDGYGLGSTEKWRGSVPDLLPLII